MHIKSSLNYLIYDFMCMMCRMCIPDYNIMRLLHATNSSTSYYKGF